MSFILFIVQISSETVTVAFPKKNPREAKNLFSAQLGISLTSGDVRRITGKNFCSLIAATMSFMCPLEVYVIIHIERGMI